MMGLLDLDVPKGCDDVCVFMFRCVCWLSAVTSVGVVTMCVCVFMYRCVCALAQCAGRTCSRK